MAPSILATLAMQKPDFKTGSSTPDTLVNTPIEEIQQEDCFNSTTKEKREISKDEKNEENFLKSKESSLEAAEIEIVLTDQTNLLPPKRVIIVFFALSICLGVVILEQTITAAILPVLSSYFNSGRESVWVATSYFVTTTAFQPSIGRFSDIFGRKTLLVVAVIEFMIASLACALSKTMTQLIIFRAFQGMGGGAILSAGMIITADIVALKSRGKYQGIMESMFAICNGVGPVLGGVFANKLSWRWCFWINLPVCAISLILIQFCLPLKKVEGSLKSKLKTVDYIGTILTLLGTVVILLALNWGGVEYSWKSGPVLGLIFGGIACWFLFCLWEWKFARLPIVPMYLFKSTSTTGIFIVSVPLGIWYVIVFYIPQLLQIAKGYSAIKSGVIIIPLLAFVTIFVLICGQITSRTGIFRAFIIIGFAFWSITTGLLSTIDENTSDSKIMGFLFLTAVGPGCIFQSSLIGVQASVDRKDMAVVTTVRSFLRFLGATLGLAIASAIINNVIKSKAHAMNLPPEILTQVLDDPTAIRHKLSSVLTPEQQIGLIKAYADGFRTVFIACAGATVFAFFVSVFLIKHHDLEREDDEERRQEAKKWLEEQKTKTTTTTTTTK